jgi:inosine/xanthosine triphosphatase
VKVEAARAAFAAVWPEYVWEAIGAKVPSHVSNQPMSDEESITGARNRANGSLAGIEAAVYAVGLEGGLQQAGGWWFDAGWAVVVDRAGREGVGSTLKLPVSARMMDMVEQGLELGDICDILFQKQNSKQINGFFGLMTNDVITRTKAYTDGVIAALARFLQPTLFEA